MKILLVLSILWSSIMPIIKINGKFVKTDDGGSIGAKGTVNFHPIYRVKDVCISTNCYSQKGSMKNQHDPRFFHIPKPKMKKPKML